MSYTPQLGDRLDEKMLRLAQLRELVLEYGGVPAEDSSPHDLAQHLEERFYLYFQDLFTSDLLSVAAAALSGTCPFDSNPTARGAYHNALARTLRYQAQKIHAQEVTKGLRAGQ